MAHRRYSAERIIPMLLQAEIELASGKSIGEIVHQRDISEQTYYRLRKLYGGMPVSQAKKLKELERETARLKKLVADLSPG